MLMKHLLTYRAIGLAAQPDALRLVCATRYRHKLEMTLMAEVMLPANVMGSKGVQDWQQFQFAMDELSLMARAPTWQVAATLPDAITVQGHLSEYIRDRQEIRRAILDQLDQDQDWQLDWMQSEDGIRYMAVPNAYLTQYLICLKQSGFKIRKIHAESCLRQLLAQYDVNTMTLHFDNTHHVSLAHYELVIAAALAGL